MPSSQRRCRTTAAAAAVVAFVALTHLSGVAALRPDEKQCAAGGAKGAVVHDPKGDKPMCLPDGKIGMELTFTSRDIIWPEREWELIVDTKLTPELQERAKAMMLEAHQGKMWATRELWGFKGGLTATLEDAEMSHFFQSLTGDAVKDTKLLAIQKWKKAVETICESEGCQVIVPPYSTLYRSKADIDPETGLGKPVGYKYAQEHLDEVEPVYFLKFEVRYDDGFWWRAFVDSWCMEVNGAPITEADLVRKHTLLQQHIWESAKSVGLAPHGRIGNGHIHFDFKSTFTGSADDVNGPVPAIALRNFVVDFENHPTFSLATFGDIRDNAPPLAILSDEARAKFAGVVAEFDASEPKWDYLKLADHLNKAMLDYTYMDGSDGLPNWVWRDRPEYGFSKGQSKYHDINLLPLSKTGTVEIRGLRPQRSAHDLIDMVYLFHCRVKLMVKKAEEGVTVEYLSKSVLNEEGVGRQMPQEDEAFERPTILKRQASDELSDYLSDTGLKEEDFQHVLQWETMPE